MSEDEKNEAAQVIDDGGFGAFPDFMGGSGMSLRDYFAAKAMQGMVSQDGWFTQKDLATDAEYCYEVADALLAARQRKD